MPLGMVDTDATAPLTTSDVEEVTSTLTISSPSSPLKDLTLAKPNFKLYDTHRIQVKIYRIVQIQY